MKKLFAIRTLIETAVLVFLLVLTPTRIRAQSALDGFDPNANGVVRIFVIQPDGKILISGDFTTLAPNGGATVTRNRIARLNPDGTLDADFDPKANDAARDIAVQADGKILIGGWFTTLAPNGGATVTRNHIARLNPDGTLDTAFDPNANGPVYDIAVQADGRVLLAGNFSTLSPNGGAAVTRNNIARLNTDGTVDTAFNPNATPGGVYSIVVQADGKILAGGSFTNIGGQPRNCVARLDPTTGLADSFNPNANGAVYVLAVQANGKVLTGGFFTNIGGQNRNSLARLDPVTGLADSFNPNSDAWLIPFIAVQPDGKILVAGAFTNIGGQMRRDVARLDAITGLADSFDPNTDNVNHSVSHYAIAVQPDGKVLLSGDFTTVAPNGGPPVTRNNIARLETDGRLDQTLNLGLGGANGNVIAIAVQPDGEILIGGIFTSVLGVARNNIARLNTDGTLDAAFNPNVTGSVTSIVLQADGKILVGGQFGSIGGQSRYNIARLDATTGLADSFAPNADSTVMSIAVQADGKIVVSGFFTGIGGQARNHIARLDATTGLADSFNPSAIGGSVVSIAVQTDGKILVGGGFGGFNSIGGQTRYYIARLDATTGLADSFNPNANYAVSAIAVQTDGKVLVAGGFTGIGGESRRHMARLDATTGLADSFDPNPDNNVISVAVQADGKILAGGTFTAIGGQTRNRIARLDAATGVADSFDPNASNSVYALAVQADGKILVGGFFTSIGGQTRNFARLTNDSAALQNLTATQSTITWTRGGSSAHFNRVTFESSSDNVNYIPLGNGTSSGSNWTLTGLSLPTGQNIYIRARGFYRCGYVNGSESITESVRNAFLGAAPIPTQVVSRKLHSGAPFDVNLPLTGNPGIECRSGGATGDYQLIFSFANTLTSVADASVTSGSGSVSSHMIDADTHNYIVNLTGVSNAQVITVGLTNVNDSAGNRSASIPISIGVLVGDTNGDGLVNSGDAQQTRNRSGQTPDATNFRSDVNIDGVVNSGDTTAVRSHSGMALP